MTAASNDELEILRESQDRALHREGIPMFVGLADERPGAAEPVASDPAGTALVARMQHFRSALGPSQRNTDMGLLISVLTAVAYSDFDRSVTG